MNQRLKLPILSGDKTCCNINKLHKKIRLVLSMKYHTSLSSLFIYILVVYCGGNRHHIHPIGERQRKFQPLLQYIQPVQNLLWFPSVSGHKVQVSLPPWQLEMEGRRAGCVTRYISFYTNFQWPLTRFPTRAQPASRGRRSESLI